MTIHFKHGGSTAARQMACPSWSTLAHGIPQGPSSSFAQEGTALHSCMEMYLKEEVASLTDFVDTVVEGITIDTDHLELLQMAYQAFTKFFTDNDIQDYDLEEMVKLDTEIGGTADVIAWNDEFVFILDWKFGQGLEVHAEDNKQGLFYAMCAEKQRPELFKNRIPAVAIIQPMPSRGTETLKIWTPGGLIFTEFKRDYATSLSSSGFAKGAHCKYCPAVAVCPEMTGAAKAALRLQPDDITKVKLALDLAMELENWARDVKAFAHQQMEEGDEIEGYKLVQKRAIRKWGDSDAVMALLKAKRGVTNGMFMEPAKLMTPAKMLKSVDKDLIGDYIVSQSSGTTLATLDDPRKPVLARGTLDL